MNKPNQRAHHNKRRNHGRDNSTLSFLELGEKLKNEYYKNDILSDFSNGENLDQLIENTEKLVKEKGEYLSSTQLRNVYDKIINAKSLVQLKMIRPQLAYLAGRASGRGTHNTKSFLSFIDLLIKETKESTLDDFKKYMEMIVAYHKFYSKTK